jgi:hypothetical protein
MFAAVKNKRAREAVMAKAEAFETDFWKHANLRKVWDDIVPGEPRKTIPYTLTANSRWVLIDVMVRNQDTEKVAAGKAMVEFPAA